MKYAFIEQMSGSHSVSALCRVLQVSLSGYCEWAKLASGAREKADHSLLQVIQKVHQQHRGAYGAL